MSDTQTIKPSLATENPPELTFKSVILGLLLACVLVISSTFLALKVGVLTASSIPASILSMSILRCFRRRHILENNLVQTCASAGEAIAGGIVYTAPILIILHVWANFPYAPTAAMAIIGGVLGVLFTIPIRRNYMQNKSLRFPEAQAIAAVLKQEHASQGQTRGLLIGGAMGALLECAQTGLKLMASQAQFLISKGHAIIGFGIGFSATLIGAGYLMGPILGASILVGAILSHIFLLPIFSESLANTITGSTASIAHHIIDNQLRFVGIAAMCIASAITLLAVLKQFSRGLFSSLRKAKQTKSIRTERDLPGVGIGIVLCVIAMFFLFHSLLPATLSTPFLSYGIISAAIIFILVIGFAASVICGYFSGLVGVAASPGSAVGIASIILASLCFTPFLHHHPSKLIIGIISICAAMVMSAACVANNNSQDLKVGNILGATPYKQQIMLLIGAVVAGLLAPAVMQLLFNVYGIANIGAHANIPTLPAPPAAAMAAITQASFTHQLPHAAIYIGGGVMIAIAILQFIIPTKIIKKLSLLGIAIGMYLPLSSSTALCLGSFVAGLVALRKNKNRRNNKRDNNRNNNHILESEDIKANENGSAGMITACGVVSGAAIINVVLAIPFALLHNPDAFAILSPKQHGTTIVLGIAGTAALLHFLYRRAMKD